MTADHVQFCDVSEDKRSENTWPLKICIKVSSVVQVNSLLMAKDFGTENTKQAYYRFKLCNSGLDSAVVDRATLRKMAFTQAYGSSYHSQS